jgi:hypothetical protein
VSYSALGKLVRKGFKNLLDQVFVARFGFFDREAHLALQE